MVVLGLILVSCWSGLWSLFALGMLQADWAGMGAGSTTTDLVDTVGFVDATPVAVVLVGVEFEEGTVVVIAAKLIVAVGGNLAA